MNTVLVRDLIVYGMLAIIVIFALKRYNIIGTRKGATKAKSDVKQAKSIYNKRKMLLKVLKRVEKFAYSFGSVPKQGVLDDYKYSISRLRWQLPYLDRPIAPIELLGLFKVIKFVSCFLAVILYLITGSPLMLIFLVGLGINLLFKVIMEGKIMQEDKEIEDAFPDLFLLLYSRLIRGTSMRLSPTLDEYIRSLDAIYDETAYKAMRHFVKDLRSNIEIYGDDSLAVHQMRDVYKSAMLINFFNLAIQSLRGVDNKDKLMGFKIELSQKRLEKMTKDADMRVSKAQKVVLLIFGILAQFVILSWVAKMGGIF